jgi:hypothetical protein
MARLLFARIAGVTGPTFTCQGPIVSGVTQWNPTSVPPANYATVLSEVLTAITTAGSHTGVSVAGEFFLPGQAGAPITQGVLRIDYDLNVVGEATTVGATYSGTGAWVNSTALGPVSQPIAIGTGGGGALPAGWSATLQIVGTGVELLVTTDAADTYTCQATVQASYTS